MIAFYFCVLMFDIVDVVSQGIYLFISLCMDWIYTRMIGMNGINSNKEDINDFK